MSTTATDWHPMPAPPTRERVIKPATKMLHGAVPLCDEHAVKYAEGKPTVVCVEREECFPCALADHVAEGLTAEFRKNALDDLLASQSVLVDASTLALGPDEFRCAMCREVFYKGRPDGEAAAEHEERFPTIPLDDCDLVCDDCFRKLSADTGIGLTPTKEPR